ncbi:ribosomal protein S18-alanine N-acetyltransferase [Paludibacterium purpuratum]|uniref:[Ribosomal protein bS18]-alanine N-acetyltransferase n=1 Tax=Paludibacterium purpuratum TaxID=1144873 RepID=A0A4R7AX74_9NEIS|nr:ribosomal protein S18-alanine N-acetyltransferase [Paludibacterium purpuratum]TDR71067.1 [SSU ribosomal protein S18P]-alanine acetyltransferase [Paludibacterium purpuratum]
MIAFRAGKPGDVEEMAALEARATAHPWRIGQYRDSLLAGHLCLVMTQDDTVCGQAFAMLVLNEAEILNIAIDPTHQGQGWGRQLLDELLTQLRQFGAHRVFLEVRESNRAARSLYQHRGFVETGLRKHYYPTATGREHAILMEIQL